MPRRWLIRQLATTHGKLSSVAWPTPEEVKVKHVPYFPVGIIDTKMNPAVKAKWIAALQSGEYPQSQGGFMRDDAGFCVQGVLVDIYAKEHGLKWEKAERHGKSFFGLAAIGGGSAFPSGKTAVFAVGEWAGLTFATNEDVVTAREEMQIQTIRLLAQLNDKGMPFNKLQDIIEVQL